MAKVDIRLGYKDSAWFTANATLVLKQGQQVHLLQTGQYKLGDGVTQLSALNFLGISAETQDLQAVTDLGNVTTNAITVDALAFDLTPTNAPSQGQIAYNGQTGALAYLLNNSNVMSNIGQTLHAYVHNADSVTILKGQPVYLFSASGNKASVKLAYNTSDATSAKTLGLAAENINAGNNGMITCQGVLDGLNTGLYNAGDSLYLGATAGTLTSSKPYAPNHVVSIGIVEKANNGAGQIYVRIQNGFELDEIHNVDLISVAPVNNDVLTYESSTSLWKNKTVATALGFTPENITNKSSSYTSSSTTTYANTKALVDGLATKENSLGFTPENVANKENTTLDTSTTKYPTNNLVKTNIDAKVTANAAITGATKTKITYDSKGLVTSGADATTADIADSLNKRYVTDANLVVIGNTSGNNTGDETQSSIQTKLGLASTSTSGYLSSTDWNTFNDKQNALGFTPENVANKATTMTGNTASNTLYLTAKAIFDWATGLFVQTTRSLTVNGTSADLSADRTFTVTDANLSTSDITTNNVSTTKHGFAPKLPNNTTQFLRGDGTYASPTVSVSVQTVTSAATVTPTTDNDLVVITAQAAALTMAIPTGTPVQGEALMIRIKDNGTARGITWTGGAGGYRAIGVTLPTTTVINKTTYVGLIYNSTDSRWDAIGVTTEA